MALTYVVGIPRSGKSYYVTYKLWKEFVYVEKVTIFTKIRDFIFGKKEKREYDFVYTNLNQFDFSKSPKFKKFDFDDFKIKITELFNLYMTKVTDDELNEKAKELNLHNVVFAIDEIHNFLKKKTVDDVLVWWVTYHGHLFQDLYFITQDLSLVNAEYKSNAEFFFRAIPPSSRLSTKKFRYTQYRNARMAMNGKISDFTVPALQEVFNMYVSGAENKSKSVVHKFLIIGFVLFLFLIPLVFIFLNQFSTDDDVKDINSTVKNIPVKEHNQNISSNSSTKKDDDVEDKLFNITCIENICTYKDVEFPKLLLTKIIKDSNSSFTYKVDNQGLIKYFLLLKEDTLNFLDFGGQENENTKSTKKNSNSNFSLL